MNKGVVQQIAQHRRIYDDPANLFFAGFIGSPPMNLLRGRADGTSFQVDGATLPLPQAAPRSGELMLGLRPEHAELSAGSGPGWPMTVEMIEMLGAERLVHGRVGTSMFTVRQDSTLTPPSIGASVALHSSPAHLHWFDASTQHRL
jgi:sn-glycerol 3-phosphate transport system ATP-binding protein